MFLFDYLICYDAAVATDEDVPPPSIKPVLLVLGVEVGESVELFVAADAFFAWDGIRVAFRAGFIASSKTRKITVQLNSRQRQTSTQKFVFYLEVIYTQVGGLATYLLPIYRDSQLDTHSVNIHS